MKFCWQEYCICACLNEAVAGNHLFFAPATQPRTIVVDFSSPNVAKPMHVGHIRSTGIGDAFQRVLRLLGHRVITDNHIGDWGTQFGMLIFGWKREWYSLSNGDAFRKALREDSLGEMERLYKQIRLECDTNPDVLEKCRQELVKLQQFEAENINIWENLVKYSQFMFEKIYSRLGVKFDQTLGESFYNPWLGEVVADLLKRGIARESEGAVGSAFSICGTNRLMAFGWSPAKYASTPCLMMLRNPILNAGDLNR